MSDSTKRSSQRGSTHITNLLVTEVVEGDDCSAIAKRISHRGSTHITLSSTKWIEVTYEELQPEKQHPELCSSEVVENASPSRKEEDSRVKEDKNEGQKRKQRKQRKQRIRKH